MKDRTSEDKCVRGALPQEVRCKGRKGEEETGVGQEGVRRRRKRTFRGSFGGQGQSWGSPNPGLFPRSSSHPTLLTPRPHQGGRVTRRPLYPLGPPPRGLRVGCKHSCRASSLLPCTVSTHPC